MYTVDAWRQTSCSVLTTTVTYMQPHNRHHFASRRSHVKVFLVITDHCLSLVLIIWFIVNLNSQRWVSFKRISAWQSEGFFFISGGPTALRPLNTVVHSFCHCRFRTFMVTPVLLISLGGDLWAEKFQWPQVYEDLSSPVVQAQSSHPSLSLGLFIQRVAVRD